MFTKLAKQSLHDLRQCQVRRINLGRPIGNFQWRNFPRGIETIALGNFISQALGSAASGPHFLACIKVEFVGCVREDDGPNIATFHDNVRRFRTSSLLSYERFAHVGNLRHFGNIAIHVIGSERGAWIRAIDE